MTVENIRHFAKAEDMDEETYLDNNCDKRFAMYYSGWECDSTAWVMNDGTCFTTNHGSLCIMTREQFETYRIQMIGVVDELNELSKRIK